jgi:hypothetical protein
MRAAPGRSRRVRPRMETVGALASGVAHNFNNFIGAITGRSELVEARRSSDNDPAARNLDAIRRAGERARGPWQRWREDQFTPGRPRRRCVRLVRQRIGPAIEQRQIVRVGVEAPRLGPVVSRATLMSVNFSSAAPAVAKEIPSLSETV